MIEPILFVVAIVSAGLVGAAGALLAASSARAEFAAQCLARVERAEAERDYWQARAELAIDASMARAGVPPIMAARRHTSTDPAAALRGLAITSVPRQGGDATT